MSDDLQIPEAGLWNLVEKWRELALSKERGRFLSPKPEVAYGQALTTAAEELADLILDAEDSAR